MRAALGAPCVVLVGVLAAGCGSSAEPPASLPTLSAAAVPYLPSVHRSLTAAFLTREAQTPDLAAKLRGWGFVAGSDRYFQGESKRLLIVDSRTLRFLRAAGAAAYVAFMQSHLGAVLGSFPQVHRFAAGSRRGILAVGQACRCHLANPSLLAIVARGATVSWLEINGPGATRRRLTALLARAP